MTRRDFINGMAVAVVAGMTPLEILAREGKAPYYPPLWQNLVGSDDDSYFFAHALRDGEKYDFGALPIQEEYDLVVVGAGISGLSAACLFHHKYKGVKSLILDNHKDFGGHARRNEFATPYGNIITYGGSESLQSPESLYSKKVVEFLGKLNINIDALAKCFNQDFYPDLGLSRGVFFNKKDFGVSKLVSGDPRVIIDDSIRKERNNARSFEEFIADFPMPQTDKDALLRLFTKPKDYLQGLNKKQKREYLKRTSYKQFLQEKVRLSPLALSFFEGVSDDFMALGIDMVSCELAQESGFPGFEAIMPSEDAHEELYIHHFPDGNASVARLMVKRLIPHIANCGSTPEEVLLAQFDYSKLDLPQNISRIRLQSTALDVRNVAGGVEIVYGSMKTKKFHKVFAKKAIMANYNAMIPYIVKELQEGQKDALAQCVKTSLIYTKVLLSNWECFTKLGIHDIYAPKSFYVNTKLDYPVDMGAYKHPRDPKKPICLHLIGSPLRLNPKGLDTTQLTAKDLSRLTRHALLETPFSKLEQMTFSHLQEMFGGAGFKKSDVLGITLNRWGHCYAYSYNSLFDNPKQIQKIMKTARKACGNIAIANSDANWDAFLHTAIEQAMRALSDIKLG